MNAEDMHPNRQMKQGVASAVDTTAFTKPRRIECQGLIVLGLFILTTALRAQPAACLQPPPGLVAWWPGDGDANDIIGNQNGTLHGGVTSTPGQVGQAFQFDGSTGFVVISPDSAIDVGNGPGLTIEGWINPSDTSQEAPIVEWGEAGAIGVHLWISVPPAGGGPGPGCLYANLIAAGNSHQLFSQTYLIVANNWQHVAVSYDAGSGIGTLYLDGAIVDQRSLGSLRLDTTYHFYLGHRPSDGGWWWTGGLDEISLYNRALSPSEIAAIYAAGNAGKCKLSRVLADTFTPVAETCTNNAIDPGERVVVSFGLRNVGGANTTNLVATLLADGGVSAPSGPQTYGVLLTNGAAVARSFAFTGSGSCGSNLTATLQLQDGATSLGTVIFTFPLGQTITTTNLFETFDGVTPPDLPAGWVTSASGVDFPWVTTTAASDTLPNSAFVPDVPDVGLSELDSPFITLPAGPSQLSFRNYYNLEWSGFVGYDGGVLEININGGGWQDILDAGGSFLSGAYVAPISTFYSNPLAGRSAWTGSSSGFVTTVVNLPSSAAGESIQLRWLCGTDDSFNWEGWYVDTVAITTVTAVCCTPPPVFTDATPSGNVLNLSWSALPGRSYQLFYTTNLVQPNWTALTTSIANDFTASATDSISPGQRRFYRVALLP